MGARNLVTVRVGLGLTSGLYVGLAAAPGLPLGFFRPWLTEKVGQVCPSIQPLRTRLVIKSPALLADTDRDATPESGPGARVLSVHRDELMSDDHTRDTRRARMADLYSLSCINMQSPLTPHITG